MTTLTDFLLARIAEDEAELVGAIPPLTALYDYEVKWQPRRIEDECKAKRRLVERLTEIASKADDGVTYTWSDTALVDSLRILASVYSGHPDYRDAWRP